MSLVMCAATSAAKVEFNYSMTIGDDGGSPQTQGYLSGSFGSMDSTDYKAATITRITTTTDVPISSQVRMTGEYDQSYFTSIDVDGTEILSADAFSFSASGGVSTWTWLSVLVPTSGTVDVVITS